MWSKVPNDNMRFVSNPLTATMSGGSSQDTGNQDIQELMERLLISGKYFLYSPLFDTHGHRPENHDGEMDMNETFQVSHIIKNSNTGTAQFIPFASDCAQYWGWFFLDPTNSSIHFVLDVAKRVNQVSGSWYKNTIHLMKCLKFTPWNTMRRSSIQCHKLVGHFGCLPKCCADRLHLHPARRNFGQQSMISLSVVKCSWYPVLLYLCNGIASLPDYVKYIEYSSWQRFHLSLVEMLETDVWICLCYRSGCETRYQWYSDFPVAPDTTHHMDTPQYNIWCVTGVLVCVLYLCNAVQVCYSFHFHALFLCSPYVHYVFYIVRYHVRDCSLLFKIIHYLFTTVQNYSLHIHYHSRLFTMCSLHDWEHSLYVHYCSLHVRHCSLPVRYHSRLFATCLLHIWIICYLFATCSTLFATVCYTCLRSFAILIVSDQFWSNRFIWLKFVHYMFDMFTSSPLYSPPIYYTFAMHFLSDSICSLYIRYMHDTMFAMYTFHNQVVVF